jgi:Ni,Fe-hydrogenase III large subunit
MMGGQAATGVAAGSATEGLSTEFGLPLRLELQFSGEGALGWQAVIREATVAGSYSYTGLEERVRDGGMEWNRALQLVEGLCANCSQANTLAFVQAAEAMAGIIVPPRADALRLVLAEMERASSHLMNAAEMMAAMQMQDRETVFRDLRERAIQGVAEWSGARLQPGLITFGGLARNIDENAVRALALTARTVERTLRAQANSLLSGRAAAPRLVGLGTVRPEEALAAGLRGPVARAAGVAFDVRAAYPSAAYESDPPAVVTQRGGDAFSRLVVRLLETLESLRLVEQAVDDLPPGPVRGRGGVELRAGSGVSRVEGPRGQVFCWVRGGEERLLSLHLSAGSHPTLGVLPGLLRGALLEDLRPLMVSLDLCLSCAER